MKTYYGNYLGLVVEDRDPQQRGRVKVFIPHIMPTLYESWNKEGKDISFNVTGVVPDGGTPGGLDKDIIVKLQTILPWAECAAPIFGSAPSGIYNYETGTTSQVAGQLGNGNFGQSTEFQSTLDDSNSQARAAVAIEQGLLSNCGSTGMCARGANNILSWYVFGQSWASVNGGDPSSGSDARSFGRLLVNRYGMSVATDTGEYQNGDTRILTGSGGTQHMETYMNGRWYSDFAQNNSSVGNSRYNSATLYRLPTTRTASSRDLDSPITSEQGEAEFGDIDSDLPLPTDENPSAEPALAQAEVRGTQQKIENEEQSSGIADGGSTELVEKNSKYINSDEEVLLSDGVSVVSAGSAEYLYTLSDDGTGKIVDKDTGETVGQAEEVVDTDFEDLPPLTDEEATDVASSGGQNPHPTEDGTVFGPNTNYAPKGFFGGAKAGQMVWVFFQEGDPLFPVYFAASYGEKEWGNINEQSSFNRVKRVKRKDSDKSDPLQGTQNTYMGHGGGFRDVQVISDQPSGFEKDEFAFEIFGKTGSCLRFTFHTTHLNSKYDFRQHTQADAHYITGGNRTDRTTGDHVTICEQDQIITIGNWSQEALDAADNIQKVVDRAMKAAKDTYES